MAFINLIKKSFRNIIENPSITLSLVLYLIMSNLILVMAFWAKTKIFAMLFILCIALLTIAFFAGWFQVINESVDIEKMKDKKYGAIFFEGVGRNFLPVAIGSFLLFILMNLGIMGIRIFAYKFFGDIQPIVEGLSLAQDSKAYILSLSDDKIYAVYCWALSGIIFLMFFSFIFLYYFPVIINDSKNNVFLKPFVAIVCSVVKVFKNFSISFFAFSFLLFLYLILAILNALFAQHSILEVLMLFIGIYFASYAFMLIFNCYEQKNNCIDGCDSIGENEIINRTSEGD